MTNDSRSRQRTEPADIPKYRYIEDDVAFVSLIDELKDCDRYGIDTEFVRERTYFARLALVQIAWAGGIALVDPLAVEMGDLARLFSGDGLALFHAADQDLEVLERACGSLPKKTFDLQVAAAFIGMSTPSLQSLVEQLLGLRIEKGDQLTDWTRRPLGENQLRYAAGDVAYLLEMHDIFCDRLESNGRLAWAEIECAELLARSRTPAVPEQAWWKMKNARQLRGASRQVAQTVCAWREARARQLDVPVRTVLSDLALIAIVHRPPRNRSELAEVRSVDGRHLAGGAADELLAAIESGRALDPSDLLVPPSPSGEAAAKPAVMLAAAWIDARARELSIDPTMLATRADLSAYLRTPPEGRLATSWRQPIVGEPIRRLLAGEASLALNRQAVLVMEERSGKPIVGQE